MKFRGPSAKPTLRWCAIAAALCLASVCEAAEIEFWHVNDVLSASRRRDDLYTATVGLGGTVKGWNLALEEHLFTDVAADIRHDETYLTVARELLPVDSSWRVRAEVGVVHIGKGLFGEDLQNAVHELINQNRLILPYSTVERTHLFVNVQTSRTVLERQGFSLTPQLELESAGFKRHARLVARIDWRLPRGFGFFFEGGHRWTRSDYPILVPWVERSRPAAVLGASYKRFVELAWSSNYYGVDDRHWRLTFRFDPTRKKKPGARGD